MKRCKVMFKKGGIPDFKFNAKQLKMGTKVEMEHTNNPCWAKQIAKSHLSEIPTYYSKLLKMENKK